MTKPEKNIANEEVQFRVPICVRCKHFFGNGACRAFDSIPDEIIFGENNHFQVMPGQKGEYVFTPDIEQV